MVALKLVKYGGLGYKAACAPVYNYSSSGKSLHKNHRPDQQTCFPVVWENFTLTQEYLHGEELL